MKFSIVMYIKWPLIFENNSKKIEFNIIVRYRK